MTPEQKTIRLDLRCVFSTPSARPDQLKTVVDEMTEKDIETYDRIGWKHYRDEDFVRQLLPELGESVLVGGNIYAGVVVPIKNRRFLVTLSESELHEPWDHMGKTLTFTETTAPLTPPSNREYLRFFGQPRWVQGPHFPLDPNGNPCYHLFTLENKWGDMGNYNVLIGLDADDLPFVAFFEASCC